MSLYRLPQEFEERLEQRFGDKFRVRWSDTWGEWQIEQKVRRGLVGTPFDRASRYHDDVIRYRDGYMWVMSVKNGTSFPCPTCGLTLKAPVKETAMVPCEGCKRHGNEYRWVASYWPLDDGLIEHLERITSEVDTRIAQQRRSMAALQDQQYRSVLQPTLDGFQDRFEQGMGIQSVGYTGREFTGGN